VEQLYVDSTQPVAGSCRFPELPHKGTWELSAFVRRGDGPTTQTHEDGLYSRRAVIIG